MELSCGNYKYSEKWDKKLLLLLKEGKITSTCDHSLTFKLKVGESKIFSGLLTIPRYEKYRVWTSNKGLSYGYLYEFKGIIVPKELRYAPSQAAMKELFELERGSRYPNITKAYE